MIDPTAQIIESEVDESARVYRNAIIRRSTLGASCIIGDMVRAEDAILACFTQIYPLGIMYSSKLGAYSYLQKNSSVWHATIGKYCSLSWNVSIGGGEHDFHKVTAHSMLYSPSCGFVDLPLYERFSEKCEIGNDVWIAAGVSVLRGVSIGDGAVIGAGAVVTHDVEPYSIVAGVPAKKIGQRCPDELIADLMTIRWWDWPPQIIKRNIMVFNQELSRDTVERLREIKEANEL